MRQSLKKYLVDMAKVIDGMRDEATRNPSVGAACAVVLHAYADAAMCALLREIRRIVRDNNKSNKQILRKLTMLRDLMYMEPITQGMRMFD